MLKNALKLALPHPFAGWQSPFLKQNTVRNAE
jgi:hypothetical protein